MAAAAGFALAVAANARTTKSDIQGLMLDRTAFSVAAMKGNVVIVNFWATWCAPCRAEMPALNQYYLAHHSDGLSMIAISMDDSGKRKTVAAVASAFAFPVAFAQDTRLPSSLRPARLPVTLIFDRRGMLRFDSRQSKATLMDSPSLNRLVGPLLSETAGQ